MSVILNQADLRNEIAGVLELNDRKKTQSGTALRLEKAYCCRYVHLHGRIRQRRDFTRH